MIILLKYQIRDGTGTNYSDKLSKVTMEDFNTIINKHFNFNQ